MTAPVQPHSNIEPLIRTIVSLRELQQRDEAAQLARQEFGLRVEMSQDEAQQHLQDLLKNSADPQSFLKYAPIFASASGKPQDFIENIINQAAPSIPAITAKKAAAAAGTIPDAAVASRTFLGALPGAVTEDALQGRIYQGASDALSAMSPAKRDTFNQGVAQRLGTGQTLREASMDEMWGALPDTEKKQWLEIAGGILPNASQAAQTRLAQAEYLARVEQMKNEAAYQGLHMEILRAEAKSKLDKAGQDEVDKVLKDIESLHSNAQRNAASRTQVDQVIDNSMYNSLVDRLWKIAPEIYGEHGTAPMPKIPINSKFGEPGSGTLFLEWLKSLPR